MCNSLVNNFGGIWANIMAGQWRIRVIGRQRQKLDVALLVQAVIALAEQLAEDERTTDQAPQSAPVDQPHPEVTP